MTVGLGASIGGLANPLIGWLADATTLRTALVTLLVLPVIALIVAMFLTLRDREEPGEDPAVVGGIGADTPRAAP
jgi:FSR family fosmidomycin resistance protein-like MFS transporter